MSSDNRGFFRNATSAGICQSLISRAVTIYIGQWHSDYMMRDDLAALRLDYYASCTNGATVMTFAIGQGTGQEIQQLMKFGFTMNSLRGNR